MLGAGAEDYDPTRQAISRLAGAGAPTRVTMTAGLVALAAGMVLFGLLLRPRPVWLLPVANGMTALAVAALPLGHGYDTAHGVTAALGYVTLAAIPVVVGRRTPVTVAASLVSALCLLTSVLVTWDGLFQRAGLTVAHLWVMVSALRLVAPRSAPTSSSTTPRVRGSAGRRR